MLYMDYDVPEERILDDPSERYKLLYEKSWFEDPEVVRVAMEIEGWTHDGSDIFEHPIFGRCTGYNASGGTIAVILAYLGETGGYTIPLSWLGENCFAPLGSLDIKHDVTFDGDYMPDLDEWGCNFISKKSGEVINDRMKHLRESGLSMEIYIETPKRVYDLALCGRVSVVFGEAGTGKQFIWDGVNYDETSGVSIQCEREMLRIEGHEHRDEDWFKHFAGYVLFLDTSQLGIATADFYANALQYDCWIIICTRALWKIPVANNVYTLKVLGKHVSLEPYLKRG